MTDADGDPPSTLSPLQMEGGKRPEDPSRPSSAYLESLKRARSSEHWHTAQMASNSRSNNSQREPGWRTKTLIAFLVTTGIVLFVVGCSFYFDPEREDTEEQKTGLDILLCSIIPLIPGLYGALIWYGSSMGWHGYSMLSLGNSYE